jgi:DNA-binding response OmpR family regulator
VLIVDADARNVEMLGAALRIHGYETLDATSFEAAMRLWRSERPAALIADIRLGHFNGLQLLLRARADRPDVRAVITSSVPDCVLEAETRRFGGWFMVKPVAPETIGTMVDSLLLQESLPAPGGERRTQQRRRSDIPGFAPDRRVAQRRRSHTN